MREILFRGKPTERFRDFLILRKEYCEEGFVTGSLILAAENRAYICVGGFCFSRSIINNGITTMVEVVPETVGQFTGLLDKNGKKIFEGDIMHCAGNVVEFCNGGFCINGDSSLAYWKGTEVIGNVHDKSEGKTHERNLV